MQDGYEGVLLGRIAVHLGFITMDQLDEATREQGRNPEKRIGSILVERRLITEAQLAELLAAQTEYAQRRSKVGLAPTAPAAGDRAPVPAGPPPQDSSASDKPIRGATPSPHAQWLNSLLTRAARRGTTDVHIHSDCPAKSRRFGRMVSLTDQPLSARQSEAVLRSVLSREQMDELDQRGQIDFAYAVPDVGRFRVNVYRQHRGLDGVFHFIPPNPPTLDDLSLPTTFAKLTTFHQGLVLVTGPAGCGKSTTLAALVNIINEERADHILTIEDPIEYLHPAKQCVVNQREVVRHTESFARALRAAMREDPDVICIAELRDLETISLALSAAETGHLVIATLHTNNAIRTISRIVGAYPHDQQAQIRTMLSEALRAIVSQRLLANASGNGFAVAFELLLSNRAVANLIRENRTFQIQSVLQTGRTQGMRLLDDSLQELVANGTVTRETAAQYAEHPALFR